MKEITSDSSPSGASMRNGSRFIFFSAIFFLLAGLNFSTLGRAENRSELRDFAVRTWTKSEGLPNTAITVILQTRDGYLWIGTAAGLFRFDGINFEPSSLFPRGTTSEISITSLCEDKGGCLWIGTQKKGLFRWQNGQGTRFVSGPSPLDPAITSLTLDNSNRVWIGTRHGVSFYDGQRLVSFETNNGLPNDSILSVHAAASGTVWITTAGGMCRFVNNNLSQFHFPASDQERDEEFLQAYEDRRGNLWAFCGTYLINLAEGKRINYFPGEKSAVTRIWSLCEGRGGRLWIGASGRGVFCFDGKKFQPVTLNEGRWPNDVRTICEDHEGDLWLGISGVGLVQLRPQTFIFLTENQGLPAGAATCVTMDAAGRVLAGMEAGGLYGSVGDHFEPIHTGDNFLDQDLITCLCSARDGSIWAGTGGMGLCRIKDGHCVTYTTANGLESDSFSSLGQDQNGVIWANSRFGGVQTFAQGRFSPSVNHTEQAPPITAMHVDAGGGWMGTSQGALIRTGPGLDRELNARSWPGLAGHAILDLAPSTNGGIWLGSDGGGLGYGKGDLRRVWNSHDGLPDDVVWAVTEDDEASLWFATPKGLWRVNSNSVAAFLTQGAPIKAKLVYETDPADARAQRLGGPHALRDGAGRLWFALNSGLVGIDIQNRETDKPAPPVHIETMLVNNEFMPVAGAQGAALDLPVSPRTLEFRYVGLSYEYPEKVRFRHRLDGFDADWVEGGQARQARYGPLPSGEYDFHVTACNAEGVWNETGASVAFVIPVPLWRRPWMLGLEAAAAITLCAAAVRLISTRRLNWRLRGIEQQQTMERERMRIAQNMHDEIGSKLTKISYLSERAKAELRGSGKAEAKVNSIAATSHELLKALDEMVWAVNPTNDTLEHLAAYLCQYAREYFQDTAVECDLRLQSHLPEVEMSAEMRHNLFLAFEESLSNVLKHAKATRLSLDISTRADALEISIRDNGAGFDPGVSAENKEIGGNGLRNMRERLSAMGGECKIYSSPAQGTTVNLSVKLNSAKMIRA